MLLFLCGCSCDLVHLICSEFLEMTSNKYVVFHNETVFVLRANAAPSQLLYMVHVTKSNRHWQIMPLFGYATIVGKTAPLCSVLC